MQTIQLIFLFLLYLILQMPQDSIVLGEKLLVQEKYRAGSAGGKVG
jgi:hypothetical protein